MKKVVIFCLLIMNFTGISQSFNQREWGTYYFGSDTGNSSMTTDKAGNIIIQGITEAVTYSPYYLSFTTPGCYQPDLLPAQTNYSKNLALAKFDPQGNLLWATYFGRRIFQATAIVTDSNNNIYTIGLTSADSNIATVGSFIETFNFIQYNNYLAKFSPSGALLWATYLHGDVYDICIDHNDEVLISGNTRFNSEISTPGTFQQNIIPYNFDNGQPNNFNAFVMKFDTNGHHVLGTYFGKADLESRVAVDDDNNIIITNISFFEDPAMETPGCHQNMTPPNATHSTSEGVITKFNPGMTQILWSTYYGGAGDDKIRALAVLNNDIYISGYTQSSTNISTPNSYEPSATGGPGFLVKFNSNGVRQWGTYFEGTIYRIATNNLDKIFIAGVVNSTSNFTTSGAFQETAVFNSANQYHAYFGEFSTNGARNWCSYFAGNIGAGIGSIAYFNQNLYLAGVTSSTTGIATVGSIQPNLSANLSSYDKVNLFIEKFTTSPLATTTFNTSNLQLYPNPSNGNFTLQGSSNNLNDNALLVIYDNQGREIASQSVKSFTKDLSQQFDFRGILSQGMYIAKLINDKEVLQTFKVVVK